MPDFGRCTEPTCDETAVRLFDCVHHCMKMVCLQHLIEHDRLIENNKRQLEIVQNEVKRLYVIYSSLIDEDKIQQDYERKLDEYKGLANEMNCLVDNHANDVEQARLFTEKLKKIIQEKQKQTGELLTIVKVEPMEEASSSTTNLQSINRFVNEKVANTNFVEDETLFIGFDRLQNMIIDTDYHRRKAMEISACKPKSESKTILPIDDTDYNIELNTQRTPGVCPLSVNGSYGVTQEHHLHRLCRKKHFNDLGNHIRQYHGLLTPIANLIARAVHANVPTSKRLIPNDLQVTDPRRTFLCPLRSECQNTYWLPASALRGHLIDIHHMNQTTAETRVRKLKKLNRNKPMSKIKEQISEVLRKIESPKKTPSKNLPFKR